MPPVCELEFAPVGVDRSHRRGFEQLDVSEQHRERLGQFLRLPLQAAEVARAAVDGAPPLGVREDRRLVDRFDQCALVAGKVHRRSLFYRVGLSNGPSRCGAGMPRTKLVRRSKWLTSGSKRAGCRSMRRWLGSSSETFWPRSGAIWLRSGLALRTLFAASPRAISRCSK